MSVSLKSKCEKLIVRLCGAFFLIPPTVDVVSLDFDEIQVPLENIETFEQNIEYFKTPREIDEYFVNLKGRKNKNMQAYFKEYRPLLLSASHTFDLPFSFQSCLIFKESHFNKNAVSHVGALGVAQFMKNTYAFLARALYSGKKLLDSEGQTILEVGTFASFEEGDLTRLSNVRMQREIYKRMYLKWLQYLYSNGLDEIDLGKTNYKRALEIPKYAIGFSSMYLYYLKQRVEQKVSNSMSNKDQMNPELYLSVAGAYNQGAGRLFKAIKQNRRRPSFAKWTRYQSRVSETGKYIRSIRNCMRSEKSSVGSKTVAGAAPTVDGQL